METQLQEKQVVKESDTGSYMDELKIKWEQFKLEYPKVRIRDAAKKLNVSEAELLATGCGETVTRLDVDFKAFLENEIPKLGKVMAITRNEEVVHERVGEYLNPGFNQSPVGMFVGEDIDLRIFLMHWKFTFAVQEEFKGKPRYSIQFFNQNGIALHKIYLIKDSNVDVFKAIIQNYASANQRVHNGVVPFVFVPEARNSNPDVALFQQEWLALKDTHDFFPLLKNHKVSRLQALEIAPKDDNHVYAKEVSNEVIKKLLQLAAQEQTPIMVFVGNKGMLQIHTGPVKKLFEMDHWYNVMDPDFNLHIKTTAIKSCWLVKKPTADGIVTSVEVFNQNEELVCTFFGKRKPGIPEDENWRALVSQLDINA